MTGNEIRCREDRSSAVSRNHHQKAVWGGYLEEQPVLPGLEDLPAGQRVYSELEHELLQQRISNQRRELRHLNRAYRRREDEHQRKLIRLQDELNRLRKLNRVLHDHNNELARGIRR